MGEYFKLWAVILPEGTGPSAGEVCFETVSMSKLKAVEKFKSNKADMWQDALDNGFYLARVKVVKVTDE